MAQEINTAGADYMHPGENKFIGGLYVPDLSNITDAPKDPSKAAIGAFDGKQYNWNVIDQVWEPTGSGQGGSWSSNESFSS